MRQDLTAPELRQQLRRGFTLIEMLTVVAIILALLGMLLVGIEAVRRAARKAKARADIAALESAIKTYLADTGKLPIPEAAQGAVEPAYFADPADPVAISNVIHQLTTINNPRGVVYLESQTNAATMHDPWGMPYAFKFDADYNGMLEYYGVSVPAPVIVISFGPNRIQENPEGNPKPDDIISEAWQIRSSRGQ